KVVSRDIEAPGPDNVAGYGRLDPYAAIYPELLEADTRISRYFYTNFITVDEKAAFIPVNPPQVGFVPVVHSSATETTPNGLRVATTENSYSYGFYNHSLVFNDGTSDLDPNKFYRLRIRVAEEFNAAPMPIVRVRIQDRKSAIVYAESFN